MFRPAHTPSPSVDPGLVGVLTTTGAGKGDASPPEVRADQAEIDYIMERYGLQESAAQEAVAEQSEAQAVVEGLLKAYPSDFAGAWIDWAPTPRIVVSWTSYFTWIPYFEDASGLHIRLNP